MGSFGVSVLTASFSLKMLFKIMIPIASKNKGSAIVILKCISEVENFFNVSMYSWWFNGAGWNCWTWQSLLSMLITLLNTINLSRPTIARKRKDTIANIWCEGIGSSMLMRYSAIGQSLSTIIGSYRIIFGSDYMKVQYRHTRSTVTVQYCQATSTMTVLYRHARSIITVL